MVEIIIKKTLDQKMRRRDFLELAARTAGIISIGSIPLINAACKNNPTGPEPPPPPPPPTIVNLQFNIYNHTLGPIKNFSLEKKAGENINIKINELGVSGIDPQRIALREAATGGKIGKYVTYSNMGETNITAPNQKMSYDIFLMNTSNGTNYQLIDQQKGGGKLWLGRFITVNRSDDGKTGPQEAIDEVISQFNAATTPGWIKYSDLTQVGSNGTITMGYGICLSGGVPVGGMHSYNHIWVNPDVCRDIGRNIIGVFIEELFEELLGVSDIHGTGSLVRDQDRYLTTEGKELLDYVGAKDTANT